MITEQDLQEAIAECQGQRNPNANTCLKLAAYYIIYDKMYGEKPNMNYSFATEPAKPKKYVGYSGDSEFLDAIAGRDVNEIIPIIDELMTVLQAVNPRLYDAAMRKIMA